MTTKQMLIEELYGILTRLPPNKDSIPSYLSQKYDKQGAAMILGDDPDNNEPEALKALCFACIKDEEEDVRLASLEALSKLNKQVALAMATCLIDDIDINVREEAEDILNYQEK